MSLIYPLIPDEAFLYFPKKQQIMQRKNDKTHRIIFDGGVKFSQQEQSKIRQLKAQMNKKQKNDHLKVYTDNILLRFLQATQFNNVNCIKALRQYKIWQDKSLPIKLTSQIQNLLKQGILYVSGRDYCYRPILVVNVGKILEISPKQKLFLETLGYFFQFVIENCIIQGQIQNWVSIIDLGNASVFSLGGTLVDTISFLSSTFRGRVHHSYLVNAPSSIKFVWGMVKGTLNQDQLRKLSISGKKYLNEQDFTQINKSQVEQKYGGTKKNITTFWPIQPYEQNFQTQKSKQIKLVSVQEYNRKHENKQLLNRKVNQKYICQKNKGFFGSVNAISQNNGKSIFSQRSFDSQNGDLTRSELNEDLEQINMKIPKQKNPPRIPVIPQSFSFNLMIQNLVNKIFS